MRLREQETEARVRMMWRQQGVAPPRTYRCPDTGACVLVSRDEIAEGDPRWHLSVSMPDRVPTWDELVEVGHRLRPGVFFVVGVPPENLWMSVHPYVLHLWEMGDPNLEAQWRSEARGPREDSAVSSSDGGGQDG